MISQIRSIYWFQIIFIGAFYALALSLPISEALKQLSAIVIILLGVHLIFENELKIKEDLVTYSAAGIIITTLFSAFTALNPLEALKGSIDIFRIMLIFLIIKNIPLNIRQVIRFKKLLFISMLLALLYGLYQLYFDSEKTVLLLNSIRQISQSYFYLLLVLSIALSSLLNNQLHKVFLLFVILSGLAGLFIMDNKATIFMGYSQINESLQLTILAWLDNNLFLGIGVENIQYINPQNYIETESTSISMNQNTYINYLVERGLFGFGLYLLFIFSVLAALIKKYIKKKDTLVIAAIIIWFATFIISGKCTTFQDENGLLIALIWGMALNEHLSASSK